MQNLSLSFDYNNQCILYDSWLIPSNKSDRMALYKSTSANTEWGEVSDVIDYYDSSDSPMCIDLHYTNEKLGMTYANRFNVIPSIIKGTLLVGIDSNGEITLWDYMKDHSTVLCHYRHDTSCRILDGRMKRFVFRYNIRFDKWGVFDRVWKQYGAEEINPEFNFVEEKLYDGTHDKLHDGRLLKYHQAGKPKKLRIQWHIGKSEYSAYFWFEEEPIREVFDKFYGAHPDTKTDFIIRIDAERRKYELSLYRYGLKEPQVIPEDVYQLLVFKNKFEDYRSNNYNQERGAWIW